MHISIINDCQCENAVARQQTRISSLIDCTISFIRVQNDIEAAGNIIDQLDANDEFAMTILANIAPRSSDSWWLKNTKGVFKKHHNGTPFCFLWIKKKLVVSTLDGLTLSLIKKLKLTDAINVIDLEKTLEVMHKNGYITAFQEKYITGSQFRSYDFVPRVAQLILSNIQPISKLIPIDNIPDAPECVWWIDNFGNCKTTLLFDELKIVENNKVKTKFGLFPYFEHLNDVPRNSSAFVRGSSGIGGQRFIEFLTQGQNTAEIFNIKTGDNIFA